MAWIFKIGKKPASVVRSGLFVLPCFRKSEHHGDCFLQEIQLHRVVRVCAVCIIVTKRILGNDYMKIRSRKIGSVLGVALRLCYCDQKDFREVVKNMLPVRWEHIRSRLATGAPDRNRTCTSLEIGT